MMDLPPPPPVFNIPAQVLELPAGAPELAGRAAFGRDNPNNPINRISRVDNPDNLPEKPMTAKEAVDKLYAQRHLWDLERKNELINNLTEHEVHDELYPKNYFNAVKDLSETKMLSEDQFHELIFDFGPALTMKASELIVKDFYNSDSSLLEDKIEQLMQVFRQTPVEELDELLAA